MSQLWVFVDLFEEEVQLAELGLPVQITVQHLPGEIFLGEIKFIDHMVKSGTRTVPIRVDVDNKDHKLKAGMFARALVRHDWPSLLAVEENAVLWSGERAVVIVRSGERRAQSGESRARKICTNRFWIFALDSRL